MAYNAVIQLPALFDVDGGSAALFGEQQVVDVMNSHLLFTLDRQASLGNGKIGFRAPASDTDTQSLIQAFNDTFLVGDTSAVNNDVDASDSTSAILGSGLLTDLDDAGTANHPAADSNVATGTFPDIKVLYQAGAPYTTGANYLSDTDGGNTNGGTDGNYYYNDSDGQHKGGAIATLHYVSGALNEIEITNGGNGYVVGDKIAINIPASIIAIADGGAASQLKITLTAASINSDGGKMNFYVNMIGNKSGAYLPKYSEGTGQIAGPHDVVDDFCNKFADSLIQAHSSGYVNIPHPDKGIPMGGRTVTDGKAPLYGNSICPEAAEKCSLGTTMARAAAVHLVGHPLAQALFSNEDTIVNELSKMEQQENSTDFAAGTWSATQEGAVGGYGETGYGSAVGGFSDARAGKQGFRFKSKLAKILSKLLGGSQADTRKFSNNGTTVDSGEDKSLKAGNGAAQAYKVMKVVATAGDAAVYETTAVAATAPDCVQFGVKDDIDATAGNFSNGLKGVIDDQGNRYDHKQAISATTATMSETHFAADGFGTGLTQEIVVAAANATATRGGVDASLTAKDAAFVVTIERSAAAATYSVAWKKIIATASGEGYQTGDVITLVLPAPINQNVLLTINGDNLITSHLGNISPMKIGDDHVNATMAAYNLTGVAKTDGVHNSVLQSIYEQCMNVPGRATELENGRNAVITAYPSGSLKLTGAGNGMAGAIATGGASDDVYGAAGTIAVAAADINITKQFTTGAALTGAVISVTVTGEGRIGNVSVTTAGGSKLHVGDVLYISSTALTQGTGDIEITLTADDLTAADETGAYNKPYANNVMLTRNLASENCVPAKFPMKAGDKLICYLRPSLALKFDQTLLDGDVNVQYVKADGSLETLDVNGIVNSSANGEAGTITSTFPGLAFDANDAGNTMQEWEDADITNTASNFVGKKVINPLHAQSGKFCWMGSPVNEKSDTSTAAVAAVAALDDTPAHTLQARTDAIEKPIAISQQLTDEITENKLDLHVWKVTMSL